MRYELSWLGVADKKTAVTCLDEPESVLSYFEKLDWVGNVVEFSKRYDSAKDKNDDWGVKILDTQHARTLSFYLIDIVKQNQNPTLDRLNFYATYKRDAVENNSWIKRLISGKDASKYTLETEAERISYKLATEILKNFLDARFLEVSKAIPSPVGFGSIMDI
jgi:hypothetical protein